eukprot:TRINITY_DN38602_c0_g1_i1.p1 TRINITY_DN38602_c0_g1~~TRINITY_DN38602_c0_g1_i1.p1  ORF type:complete len:660 (-),score=125.75 TRINITY_DN38602_c0_g1_i1:215-2050(-)
MYGTDHFLRNLPRDRLTREEENLRQALIDFLNVRPEPFPLVDWIDARIGGEVETFRNERGNFDIRRPRGDYGGKPACGGKGDYGGKGDIGRWGDHGGKGERQAPPRADAFFSHLANDRFSPPESALRDAVLQYVSANKDRAFLAAIMRDQRVHLARVNFMPEEVSFREWIDRRVGGEIDLQWDSGARDYVARLLGAEGAPPEETPMGAEDRNKRKEDFFNGLPSDGFTVDEERLRGALLKFLEEWRLAWCPSLSDAGGDPEVRRWRNMLLPKSLPVSMKEWIEKRVGGEISTMEDPYNRRGVLLGFPGRLEEMAKVEKEPTSKGAKGKGKGGDEPKGGKPDSERLQSKEIDAFLNSLPEGELKDEELVLREALLEHLSERDAPASIDEVAADPGIADFVAALLPEDVPLRAWVQGRIGAEVDVFRQHKDGQWMIENREAHQKRKEEALDERSKAKDAFFDALPADGFSPEETRLREALLKFMSFYSEGWALFNDACQDYEVKRSKDKLLPKGCPVNFKAWVENRIGGELELLLDKRDNQMLIGFVGKVEAGMQARTPGNPGAGKSSGKKGKGAGKADGGGKGHSARDWSRADSDRSRPADSGETPWKKRRY